jgi:hypothetical protein
MTKEKYALIKNLWRISIMSLDGLGLLAQDIRI